MRYRLFGPTGLRVSRLAAPRAFLRLTPLIAGIESMVVPGDVGGKGIEYPIGAGSAWIPG